MRSFLFGVPKTLAGKTLTSPEINGTVKTTGLTMPAFTMGGDITGGDHAITSLIGLGGRTNSYMYIAARRQASGDGLIIYTTGVSPGYADTARCTFQGGAAEVVVAWTACTHTGIKLGGALALNGQDLVADTSTGTKFATATDQKIAFYGATPVVKQTGVAVNASGIHEALVNLGLIAA